MDEQEAWEIGKSVPTWWVDIELVSCAFKGKDYGMRNGEK